MEIEMEDSKDNSTLAKDELHLSMQEEPKSLTLRNENLKTADDIVNIRVEENNEASQDATLVELSPAVDSPLRLDPSMYMKAPRRTEAVSRDSRIRATVFSPSAYAQTFHRMQTTVNKHMETQMESQGATTTSIKDFGVLAFSAQRGGKRQAEGIAYFSNGILNDNMGKYKKSLEYYEKFLNVCKGLNDSTGMALAYNAMGVNCMYLAYDNGKDTSFNRSRPPLEQSTTYLERASTYHSSHLKCADEASTFVAYTNLGLVAGEMQDFNLAAQYHQEALRLAIELQCKPLQSTAVCNLGLLALRQGDATTSKACLLQHLQLTEDLNDKASKLGALLYLGESLRRSQKLTESYSYYEEARKLAVSQNELGTLKRINCMLGAVAGDKNLEDFFKSMDCV